MKRSPFPRTRVAAGASLLVLGLGLASAAPAIAASGPGDVKDKNVVQTDHLTEQAAFKAARAAFAAAGIAAISL
ncbi:hypothetical protein ACFTWS_03230 [Streptomyces sp. NPDC057027]|uniref:hypothetical protein n=1 Tax=Streptomyces sp. NPDC057027 TaxID=3346004 RepID=UPI0036379D8D